MQQRRIHLVDVPHQAEIHELGLTRVILYLHRLALVGREHAAVHTADAGHRQAGGAQVRQQIGVQAAGQHHLGGVQHLGGGHAPARHFLHRQIQRFTQGVHAGAAAVHHHQLDGEAPQHR